MAKIYTTMTELIGRTPLLEVKKIEENLGLQARILVKLEYFNPAGSVKDRAALAMILDASLSRQVEIQELDWQRLRLQEGIVRSLQCRRR